VKGSTYTVEGETNKKYSKACVLLLLLLMMMIMIMIMMNFSGCLINMFGTFSLRKRKNFPFPLSQVEVKGKL
jgi:hypothetical protein